MLAFIRFLMNLKNHEHTLIQKYHQDHPRYLLYLAIDAVLSMALVFGAVQVNTSVASESDSVLFTHAGSVALTAEELKKHDPGSLHHGHEFWLGPLGGYTYTTNCLTTGVLTVTYLSPGQKATEITSPYMQISTYENQAIFEQGLHRLHGKPDATKTNIRGDLLVYDATLMNDLTIFRAQSHEIVKIKYGLPQSLETVTHDSENLQQVR